MGMLGWLALGFSSLALAACGIGGPVAAAGEDPDRPGLAPPLPDGRGSPTADLGSVDYRVKDLGSAMQAPETCRPKDLECVLRARRYVRYAIMAARTSLYAASQLVAVGPCRDALVAFDNDLLAHEKAEIALMEALAARGDTDRAHAEEAAAAAAWPATYAGARGACTQR